MEKLTKLDKHGNAYTSEKMNDRGLYSVDGTTYLKTGVCAFDGKPIDLLHQYETTNQTPAQVEDMKRLLELVLENNNCLNCRKSIGGIGYNKWLKKYNVYCCETRENHNIRIGCKRFESMYQYRFNQCVYNENH